jgi:hypothetical protein
VEGVLAAGAVNNAREGGNLIPTVAFGIPGSVSMAILLSVFLIKGLVPGPAMLTRNLDITYSMVWVIVLSNIIAVSLSFLFIAHLAKLTHLKGTLLVPFLLVLTAFGAYTAHNSFADILVMLCATAVGVLGIRWDWPRAPLLLALVLGDIAERYLFLSYSLYQWTWLIRPLVIAFAIVTVAGVLWPLVRARFGARNTVRPRAKLGERPTVAPRVDLAITLGFLIVAVVVLFQASRWPFRTGLFPLATGSILLGAVLLKLAVALLPSRQKVVAEPGVFATATRAEWLSALGWMAAFFVTLWVLGTLVAVPLFALVYLLTASRESPVLAGSYALASWIFVYGLFGRLLRVPLP